MLSDQVAGQIGKTEHQNDEPQMAFFQRTRDQCWSTARPRLKMRLFRQPQSTELTRHFRNSKSPKKMEGSRLSKNGSKYTEIRAITKQGMIGRRTSRKGRWKAMMQLCVLKRDGALGSAKRKLTGRCVPSSPYFEGFKPSWRPIIRG